MDIQSALRSKVKGIQLVSICLSRYWKKYGDLACNKNLVEDLKILETEGVRVTKPVERVVKAGLAVITGDNLGQHSLAQMNTCFSAGKICR